MIKSHRLPIHLSLLDILTAFVIRKLNAFHLLQRFMDSMSLLTSLRIEHVECIAGF